MDELEVKSKAFLAAGEGEEPAAMPVMENDDGTINREKTLALACYDGFVD